MGIRASKDRFKPLLIVDRLIMKSINIAIVLKNHKKHDIIIAFIFSSPPVSAKYIKKKKGSGEKNAKIHLAILSFDSFILE
jgi:hypothetical protein